MLRMNSFSNHQATKSLNRRTQGQGMLSALYYSFMDTRLKLLGTLFLF